MPSNSDRANLWYRRGSATLNYSFVTAKSRLQRLRRAGATIFAHYVARAKRMPPSQRAELATPQRRRRPPPSTTSKSQLQRLQHIDTTIFELRALTAESRLQRLQRADATISTHKAHPTHQTREPCSACPSREHNSRKKGAEKVRLWNTRLRNMQPSQPQAKSRGNVRAQRVLGSTMLKG